ncbi:hypothetical protein AX15_006014 [Amanita polypyramis BW_CC]|nr:hypothetical protein AX15_006014 [Amanita polypyramis BW_CC]
MSSHSGGPSRGFHLSGRDKWSQTDSSRNLGKSLAPPSQRPRSAQLSPVADDEGNWESAPPSPIPSLPFPASPLCPEPSQDNILGNIAFQASQLDGLIHQIEGSSFGCASPALEQLLENLMALFSLGWLIWSIHLTTS